MLTELVKTLKALRSPAQMLTLLNTVIPQLMDHGTFFPTSLLLPKNMCPLEPRLENASLVRAPCFHQQENKIPQNSLCPHKCFHQEVRCNTHYMPRTLSCFIPRAERSAWHTIGLQ